MFVKRKLTLATKLLVKALESLARNRDIAVVREHDGEFLLIKTPGIEVWIDKSLKMLRFKWYERGELWIYDERGVDVDKIYGKIRDEVFKTIRDPSYQPDITGVAELVESVLAEKPKK
jgi:hypothetical protein